MRKREKERSVRRGGGEEKRGEVLRAAGAPLTWQRCSGRSGRATRQGERSEPRGRGEEGRRGGGEEVRRGGGEEVRR